MGTRNITRIRKDGELKVCQYGQWDGYPTTAGRHILEFVAGHDMDAFAAKVAGCTLTRISRDPDTKTYYTGAPVTPDVAEFSKAYHDLLMAKPLGSCANFEQVRREALVQVAERFGDGLLAKYMVASRDTGYEILDVIERFGPQSLYCDDYFLMEECDWQIEAINEVDLDARAVRMEYHGHRREFSFAEIGAMDIAGEMAGFEDEADRPGESEAA